jgi:hypothetical protein
MLCPLARLSLVTDSECRMTVVEEMGHSAATRAWALTVAAVRNLDHIIVAELTRVLRCLLGPTRRAVRQPA